MTTTIRDFLPFGDIGPDLIQRVAADRQGVPVDQLGAVFALGKAAVGMLELIAEPLADAGLSPARWRLLMTLRYQSETTGSSINEIAGHLEIREPTVTATVDRAVKDGLVERRKDPHDRRITRVRLTPAGHETIERLFPQVLGRLLAFSRAIGGPDEMSDLAARLDRAVEAATPERNT
ncbi:MAG TPA: MarR family winged helix-turn-helix transcriptional regulator [Acidimicrobiia bacterium]